MVIHICTFKIISAQQEASNIFHTLALTARSPQNDPLTLILEMSPKLKKTTSFLLQRSSMPTSQKDSSHFTKLLLWKYFLQQAHQEQHGDCHRPVLGACLKITYQSVSSKLLFNVLLARNHLSMLILQTVGVNANALVPSVRKVLHSAADRHLQQHVSQELLLH